MRKKYVNPTCERVDILIEGMIASSLDKFKGHADGDFMELTKGKNKENSPWDNDGAIW